MHVVYKNPYYVKSSLNIRLKTPEEMEEAKKKEVDELLERCRVKEGVLPGFGYAHTPVTPSPVQPPVSKLTYVYLMKNNRNGYYKIGKSANPSFREKTLQAEDPDISLIAKWHTEPRWEKILHQEYKSKRLRGEWFNLTAEDVRHIKLTMKNHL